MTMLPTNEIELTLKSAKTDKPKKRAQTVELTVFPINATTEVFVGYPAEADGMSELLVFDAQGRLISRLKLNHNGFLSMDISHYAQGSYHVVLFSNGLNVASGRFNKLK